MSAPGVRTRSCRKRRCERQIPRHRSQDPLPDPERADGLGASAPMGRRLAAHHPLAGPPDPADRICPARLLYHPPRDDALRYIPAGTLHLLKFPSPLNFHNESAYAACTTFVRAEPGGSDAQRDCRLIFCKTRNANTAGALTRRPRTPLTPRIARSIEDDAMPHRPHFFADVSRCQIRLRTRRHFPCSKGSELRHARCSL